MRPGVNRPKLDAAMSKYHGEQKRHPHRFPGGRAQASAKAYAAADEGGRVSRRSPKKK